ncbi:MAG TPA: Smr/MutS family protein [Myxococcota bacterium]|jgi:dsDNA-specific endonuclease/ATPase MutS2|nr:Smr/MutS family protein [Myxococcota bacterium]HON26239.1 Smr/MutS family protein [Myxococcota bacterium]HOS62474.1 Smr/MutS family protein [Myxococcota bacterium]HPC90627.1 Smr/MutS family protein [Myxococcota bacterium]HPL25607.1 Smr/MutS family protein [Myxococcota bacterium]
MDSKDVQTDAVELEPVEIEIDGVLDLHQFSPKDTKDVVSVYLDECLALGIDTVRIIHGKGVGVQRRIVHSVLKRHPAVIDFKDADSWAGGWGATVVSLDLSQRGVNPV